MKKVIFLLSMTLLLSACTSMGRLAKDARLDSDKESVFVIGVAPENYRISVFPGSIKDGRFHQNQIRSAAVFGAPENGFVVGKASVGDTLAVTNIRVVKDKSDVLGADFTACNDAKTMVFNIPGGKVLYLGNVEYKFGNKQLTVKYRQDLDSAKKFINENYPNLRGRLQSWDYQLLQTNASCTNTIYVPAVHVQ